MRPASSAKKRGDQVEAGEPVAEKYMHARRNLVAQACDEVSAAYTFGADAPPRRPIVLETIS